MPLAVTFVPSDEGSITRYDFVPNPQVALDEGVLLVNSGPWDTMRLSWVQKQICNQLMERGYHVVRFDLCGTGDSPQATDAASWERWVKESCLIRDQLRKTVRKVHILGFRLGAALALKASESYAFRSVHLIDPVLDGPTFWDNLNALQKNFLAFQNRYGTQIETQEEIFGFPLGSAWKAAFDGLDFRQFDGKGRRAYLYTSQTHPVQEAFVERLNGKSWEVKTLPITDDFSWQDPIKMHLQCFAQQTLQSISQVFAEL